MVPWRVVSKDASRVYRRRVRDRAKANLSDHLGEQFVVGAVVGVVTGVLALAATGDVTSLLFGLVGSGAYVSWAAWMHGRQAPVELQGEADTKIEELAAERDSLVEQLQTTADLGHLSQLSQAGSALRDWTFHAPDQNEWEGKVNAWIAEVAAWVEGHLGLPAHTIFMDTSGLVPVGSAPMSRYQTTLTRLERHLSNIIDLLKQ